MKKLLLFGGTFNPVHNGHLALCDLAHKALSPDITLIMPSYIPPHKEVTDNTSPQHRINMCKLAFEGLEGFEVSDLEITHGGKSYTYETLRRLKEIYPDETIFLLVGSDMFFTMERWINPQDIFKNAVIVAAPRQNGEIQQLLEKKAFLTSLGAECIVLEAAAYEISSTEIREKIARGESAAEYLPESVADYIEKNALYRK